MGAQDNATGKVSEVLSRQRRLRGDIGWCQFLAQLAVSRPGAALRQLAVIGRFFPSANRLLGWLLARRLGLWRLRAFAAL